MTPDTGTRTPASGGNTHKAARAFFREAVTEQVRAELLIERGEFVGEFHRLLGETGWISLQWPPEYGGGGGTQLDGSIVQEEAALAGAPMLASNLSTIVGNTLIHSGPPDLARQLLPGLADGTTVVCLGYSEPEAGSDLASLRTRAVRDGDHWVISGSKMFTSLAHVADFMVCACRTNPDEPRHRGISIFMVPMDDVEVRPVFTLGGFRTNATFLDEVRVPQANLVGELNGGWRVLMQALDFERAGTVTARVGQTRRVLALTYAALLEQGRLNALEPRRSELSDMIARLCAVRELAYDLADRLDAGVGMPAHASAAKVVATETLQAVTSIALDLLGPLGQLGPGAEDAAAEGQIQEEFRNAVRYSVTAGANEVQRNLVASFGLGMSKR